MYANKNEERETTIVGGTNYIDKMQQQAYMPRSASAPAIAENVSDAFIPQYNSGGGNFDAAPSRLNPRIPNKVMKGGDGGFGPGEFYEEGSEHILGSLLLESKPKTPLDLLQVTWKPAHRHHFLFSILLFLWLFYHLYLYSIPFPLGGFSAVICGIGKPAPCCRSGSARATEAAAPPPASASAPPEWSRPSVRWHWYRA